MTQARSLAAAGEMFERWPLYPAAAAAAMIVTYHTNAAAAPEALVRPAIVMVGLAVAIQLLTTVVGRDARQAGIVALLPLALFAPWVALVIPVGGFVVALGLLLRRRIIPWRALTGFLNATGLIWLALAVVTAAAAGGPTPRLFRSAIADSAPAGTPDIYVILLDGYPRADTLLEDFGIDNEPFLKAMEAEGFDVARMSRSNYNMTILTLASMFNYQPVDELPLASESQPALEQYRQMTKSINEGRAFGELHRLGYGVTTIVSPSSETAVYSADRVIDSGHATFFEVTLLRESVMREMLPDLQRELLADQQRSRTRSSFASLQTIAAEERDRPAFVFAHFFTPHGPLLFGPNGEDREPWPCFPADCEFWDSGWRHGVEVVAPALQDELTYLNGQVLDVVRTIKSEASEPPVIVVMSDHGFRHMPGDRQETSRNLLMTLTPGHDGLFPDDATPINVFPRILNAYFDAELVKAEEISYWTDMSTVWTRGLLDLERVD